MINLIIEDDDSLDQAEENSSLVNNYDLISKNNFKLFKGEIDFKI
jgi:hypothetical protein